jgi:hypothetical protein
VIISFPSHLNRRLGKVPDLSNPGIKFGLPTAALSQPGNPSTTSSANLPEERLENTAWSAPQAHFIAAETQRQIPGLLALTPLITIVPKLVAHLSIICRLVITRVLALASFSGSCRARALHNNVSHIKLDKHGRICLEVLDRDSKSEVVEEKKLELEVVELS